MGMAGTAEDAGMFERNGARDCNLGRSMRAELDAALFNTSSNTCAHAPR